ncbi:MAG: putative Pre-mRNA-splicing factor SYF1 [Streblomastix strix]|uniref:Putative Pre-mRNA-splicing factor SYF1 n=1 Tax=Streblomastix strix TaxID=222440 RepID=A0A5J4VBD6_9EUKA|nr:MAG: putative Pre-mRNA-splicing factor SYF1 [Streblomastix strix]
MTDLGIITPLLIVTHASLLLEKKYIEECTRVLAKGTQLFDLPRSEPIWIMRLQLLVEMGRPRNKDKERKDEINNEKRNARGAGILLERVRDTFEEALAEINGQQIIEQGFQNQSTSLQKYNEKSNTNSQSQSQISSQQQTKASALDRVSSQFLYAVHVLYAQMEEERGRPRRVLSILSRGTRTLARATVASNAPNAFNSGSSSSPTSPYDVYEMAKLHISKTSYYFGAPQARKPYEDSIQILLRCSGLRERVNEEEKRKIEGGRKALQLATPIECAVLIGLDYVRLEVLLGEIDRARAVFVALHRLASPPSNYRLFWDEWRDFELRKGNTDTFRAHSRMKRTSEAEGGSGGEKAIAEGGGIGLLQSSNIVWARMLSAQGRSAEDISRETMAVVDQIEKKEEQKEKQKEKLKGVYVNKDKGRGRGRGIGRGK